MPVVRPYERQVRQSAQPTGYQNINAPAGAFGSLNAAATENFGGQVSRASDEMARIAIDQARERNIFETADLERQAREQYQNFMYDPENGLLNRRGRDALGSYRDAGAELDGIRNRLMSSASNDAVRQAFAQSFMRFQPSALGDAQRFELEQTQVYKAGVAEAGIVAARESVALDPLNGQRFDEELSRAMSSARAMGILNGWDDQRTGLYMREQRSSVYATRLNAMVASNQPEQILAAHRLYNEAAAKGEIALADRSRLDTLFNAAVKPAAAQMALSQLGADNPILQAANMVQAEGLDPAYAAKVAMIESGGRADARNPRSSATGIYQFIDSTWEQYGQGGDRNDVTASTQAFIRLTQDNHKVLMERLGRLPTTAELYLAHQQGANGAASLLESPDAPAASIVGPDAVALNGGTVDMTAAEFVAMISEKYEAADISGVATGNHYTVDQVTAMAAQLDQQYGPGAGAELVSLIDQRRKMEEAAREAAQTQLLQQALPLVWESNGNLAVISPEMRAQLMQAGVWDKVAEYRGVSDREIYQNLRERVASGENVNLYMYSNALSRSDFNSLSDLMGGSRSTRVSVQGRDDLIKTALGSNKTSGTFFRIQSQLDSEIAAYAAENNGSMPDNAWMREVVGRLVLDTDGWGSSRVVDVVGEEYDVEGIPQDRLPLVTGALNTFGAQISNDSVRDFADNPARFIRIPGIPDGAVNSIVQSFMRSGRAITRENIISRFNEGRASGQQQ